MVVSCRRQMVCVIHKILHCKKESCLSDNRKSQELLPVFGSNTVFALYVVIQLDLLLPDTMEYPYSNGSHHETEYAEQQRITLPLLLRFHILLCLR
jgi:hypothetical protein